MLNQRPRAPPRDLRSHKLSMTKNAERPMEMTEEYANERTTTITCEPLPPYDSNGEASPSPLPTARAAGPEPRPVTAAKVRRRRLWEQGILVLENKSRVVDPIDEDLTTESMRT
jgi:hypothetical protein